MLLLIFRAFRFIHLPLVPLVVAVAVQLTVVQLAVAAPFNFDDLLPPGESRGQSGPQMPVLPAELAGRLKTATDAFLAGDFATAEPLVAQITVDVPHSPEAWHLFGLVLANLKRYDESLAALDRSADLYKSNAGPLIMKGELLIHLGRIEEARAAYAAAVERDQNDWRATEAYAQFLESEGSFESARKYYLLSVEAGPPDRLYPRLKLAELYIKAGEAAEAIALLKRYVEMNPGDVRGIAALSRLMLEDRRIDEAMKLIEDAIRAHPDAPILAVMNARTLRDAGRLDDAIQALISAKTRFADSAQIAFELGSLYGATRNYKVAMETFREGLAVHPDDRALLKGLSLTYVRMGDDAAALPSAEALARRSDTSADDLIWLGSVYERLKRTDDARRAYGAALKKHPDNWLALNNLAALVTESDPVNALTLAERAAELAPDVAAIRDTLGWAALKAGDAGRAGRIYADLHAASPGDPVLSYRLGMAYLAGGRVVEGRALLKAALAVAPDFRYAEEARKALAN